MCREKIVITGNDENDRVDTIFTSLKTLFPLNGNSQFHIAG